MYEIKETFREDMHTMNAANYRKVLEENYEDQDEYAENSSMKNPHLFLTAVYNQTGSFESK